MRHFRFTLRELFLLTVIVAVCLAWWVDRWRLSSQVHQLEVNLIVQDILDDMSCGVEQTGRAIIKEQNRSEEGTEP